MEIDAGPDDTGAREEGTASFSRPLNSDLFPTACDVAIVGGGVIGAAVVYFLTQIPLQACLLEAGDIGTGASGACDGFLSLQSKEPGALLEAAKASLELFRALPVEKAEMIEYGNCGGMLLAQDATSLDVLRGMAVRAAECNLAVDILTPAEAREMEPSLGPSLAGASLCSVEGQVNPLNLTLALARGAAQAGAHIFESCPVTGIAHAEGYWSLATPAGVLRAERVVCCAGAWTPALCKHLGIDIPIYPLKGQVMVTEYTGPLFSHTLGGAEYLASKHRELGGSRSPVGFSSGFTAEWTRSGNILLGSTREDAGFDRSTTPEAMRAITQLARSYVPALERLDVIRSYAGLRPQSVDGMPLVGELPGHTGFFLAAGHGGDGIALSLETGKCMSEALISGRMPDEMVPFSPSRFR